MRKKYPITSTKYRYHWLKMRWVISSISLLLPSHTLEGKSVHTYLVSVKWVRAYHCMCKITKVYVFCSQKYTLSLWSMIISQYVYFKCTNKAIRSVEIETMNNKQIIKKMTCNSYQWNIIKMCIIKMRDSSRVSYPVLCSSFRTGHILAVLW